MKVDRIRPGEIDFGAFANTITRHPLDRVSALRRDDIRSLLANILNTEMGGEEVVAVRAKDGEIDLGLGFLVPLPWDSDVLETPSGRIDLYLTDAGAAREAETASALAADLLDVAGDRKLRFLWTKCPGDAPGCVHALDAAGFQIMDCEITLAYRRDQAPEIPAADDAFHVERINNVPVPALAILGETFHLSRFHADPNIPNEMADNLWRRSVANACDGFADFVFIGLHDDTPVGLVSCIDIPDSQAAFGKPLRILFHVGVLPAYQGKGYGRHLVATAVSHSLVECAAITVATQSSNAAALRLYQESGFQVASSQITLHRWK